LLNILWTSWSGETNNQSGEGAGEAVSTCEGEGEGEEWGETRLELEEATILQSDAWLLNDLPRFLHPHLLSLYGELDVDAGGL
jgi:hypothetical protein